MLLPTDKQTLVLAGIPELLLWNNYAHLSDGELDNSTFVLYVLKFLSCRLKYTRRHVPTLLVHSGIQEELAATFEKAESANSLAFARNECLVMCGVPIFVWVLINAIWLL